jgi:hypothetical protein
MPTDARRTRACNDAALAESLLFRRGADADKTRTQDKAFGKQ